MKIHSSILIFRYVVVSENTEIINENLNGIYSDGYDFMLMADRLGLPNFADAVNIDRQSHTWLPDMGKVKEVLENQDGLSWFTELGNSIFKRKSFDMLLARMERNRAVYQFKKYINIDDPNIIYSDKYQLYIQK